MPIAPDRTPYAEVGLWKPTAREALWTIPTDRADQLMRHPDHMVHPDPLAAWHAIVASSDAAGLDVLLTDDCVFRSPAVHAPQEGKELTTAYLTAALKVLGPTLTYQRQWPAEDGAVLEFTAHLDDTDVHGVDIIGWNADGKITDFTVMVRPVRGLNVVIAKMAQELFG